jgi:hypothetical protein
MLTYETASKKPEAFRSLTGLSVEEFQELYTEVEQVYPTAEDRVRPLDGQAGLAKGTRPVDDRVVYVINAVQGDPYRGCA